MPRAQAGNGGGEAAGRLWIPCESARASMRRRYAATALLARSRATNRRACRLVLMSDKVALSDMLLFIVNHARVVAFGSLERPARRRFCRPFGRGSMDSGPWIAG